MFTPDDRAQLRSQLLAKAEADPRITGAALTGSAATDAEDALSDIDLAFGIAPGADRAQVIADWTEFLYTHHGVLHHLDVPAGPWLYRVYLTQSTLQIDLAFVAADEFRAIAPSFRLVSGVAQEPRHLPAPLAADLIGWAWLYALHVRSSVARGRFWQAEYMISGMRDTVLALACLRHGLPTTHGRGFDQLPAELREAFGGALVRRLDHEELRRAFGAVTECLIRETGATDAALSARLHDALIELTSG
jgi:hypothetical protein